MDMKSQPTRAPLAARTHALLRQMIEDGRIKPGQRLLEVQVATAFSISRSPARAALLKLLDEGCVEDDGGPGFRVVGEAAGETGDSPALLAPSRISAPARWEGLHETLEQELLVQMLYGSVRINELQLAQHHGVSRTVTRDLLARMHGNGLITKDRAGHWIAERITPERIRDLYEVRWLLEPAALLHAAPHIPPAILATVRKRLLGALSKSHVHGTEFDRVEVDLHVKLLSYCPNAEMLRALGRTHVLFAPTRHLLHPQLKIPSRLIRDALQEHLEVVDRLAADDAHGAAETLKRHLIDAVDRWMRRFAVSAQTARVSPPSYLSPLQG